MAERLIEKLDRLGTEAGIKQMTPEVYRFALDVRKDLVSEWPKREWVGLTDAEIQAYWDWEDWQTGAGRSTIFEMVRDIEAKLRSKNNGL
jgi:hypothetical protein